MVKSTSIALVASTLPILAAEASGTIGASVDWSGLIEKGGTIGVLVWMVLWFQKRSDEDKGRIELLAERAMTALEKNAESQNGVASAIRELKEEMHK